jgi:hypothetical protein
MVCRLTKSTGTLLNAHAEGLLAGEPTRPVRDNPGRLQAATASKQAALAATCMGSQLSQPAAGRCQGVVRQPLHGQEERMSADEPGVDTERVTIPTEGC